MVIGVVLAILTALPNPTDSSSRSRYPDQEVQGNTGSQDRYENGEYDEAMAVRTYNESRSGPWCPPPMLHRRAHQPVTAIGTSGAIPFVRITNLSNIYNTPIYVRALRMDNSPSSETVSQ
jgi:hypothetical protein